MLLIKEIIIIQDRLCDILACVNGNFAFRNKLSEIDDIL